MSDDVFYAVFCDQCHALTEIETTADEVIEGKAVAGRYVCAECGRSFGVWIDGGMLDLGLAEESTEGTNDYEVFTEEPWRT